MTLWKEILLTELKWKHFGSEFVQKKNEKMRIKSALLFTLYDCTYDFKAYCLLKLNRKLSIKLQRLFLKQLDLTYLHLQNLFNIISLKFSE